MLVRLVSEGKHFPLLSVSLSCRAWIRSGASKSESRMRISREITLAVPNGWLTVGKTQAIHSSMDHPFLADWSYSQASFIHSGIHGFTGAEAEANSTCQSAKML